MGNPGDKAKRAYEGALNYLRCHGIALSGAPRVRVVARLLAQEIGERTSLRTRDEARAYLLDFAQRERKQAKRPLKGTPPTKPETPPSGPAFFDSRAWRVVRYRALKASDGCCELCGRSKQDGAILQVDHIQPRSRFPELALRLDNLQVLCRDCNLGKGAWDTTDHRKPQAAMH